MSKNSCSGLDRVPRTGVVLVAGLLTAAAIVGGCGSGSTSLVGPTTPKCQISVGNFTGSFGPSGGTGSVAVEAARECAWSASTATTWIGLPASPRGQGPGTLNFNVQPNQVPEGRTGTLEVNGQRLSVTQEPAPCRFQLSAGGQELPAAGGTGSVNVSTMEGCAWAAASPVPWVAVVAGASGSGPGVVQYSVAANAGLERSAVLTVAGQSYTVEQAAAPPAPAPTPPPTSPTPPPTPPTPPPPTPPTPPPPTPPTPPPPNCEFSVAPGALSFAAGGGEATVSVNTSGSCPWQAASGADWLTVAPAGGTGSGSVTVTAQPNTSSGSRTAAVSIAGQTIGVSQSGAAPTLVQLSGEVRSPQGNCPNRSFTVNSTRVVASATTQYVDSACSDLKNRRQVFVEGLQGTDGTVAATRIQVQDNDDDDDDDEGDEDDES